MHWTKTKPNRPGWWWQRTPITPQGYVTKLHASHNGELMNGACSLRFGYEDSEWSSEPVPKPGELQKHTHEGPDYMCAICGQAPAHESHKRVGE